MPAGAIIGTIEWVAPYVCYRWKGMRTWMITVCQCVSALSSLLLWNLPLSNTGGLLFACYILAFFGGSYAVLMVRKARTRTVS